MGGRARAAYECLARPSLRLPAPRPDDAHQDVAAAGEVIHADVFHPARVPGAVTRAKYREDQWMARIQGVRRPRQQQPEISAQIRIVGCEFLHDSTEVVFGRRQRFARERPTLELKPARRRIAAQLAAAIDP